jgi:hypothetical protein
MAKDVIWRPVPGYEGQYLVSNSGEIISLPRTTYRAKRKGSDEVVAQPLDGKTLKPGFNGSHLSVALCKNGICTKVNVHSIVASVFLGPPPEYNNVQICHNDGDGRNNASSNLRYDTPTGNAKDRLRHGTDARGENNPANKYNVEQILHVKQLLQKHTQIEVSRLTGIPSSTVGGIKQGKVWKHI